MNEESKPKPRPKMERQYRIDIKRCIRAGCDGELAEISHYERNNWATVEMQCNTCSTRFVIKVEL